MFLFILVVAVHILCGIIAFGLLNASIRYDYVILDELSLELILGMPVLAGPLYLMFVLLYLLFTNGIKCMFKHGVRL